MSFIPDPRLIRMYIEWIEQFDERHAQNWAKLYRNDAEAAMSEASTWALLTDCEVTVEPNADLDGAQKAPDFLCRKRASVFYVEVTCIQIATATNKTSLSHSGGIRAQNYANLNDLIFWECQNKTPQCASVNAPCLVSVVTFHGRASAICVEKHHLEMLLTGEQFLAFEVGVARGTSRGEPQNVTNLRSAAFVKPGAERVDDARCPVSGLIVGGFGVSPPQVFGMLHPNPAHAFDPSLLNRIEFGYLTDQYRSGKLEVVWGAFNE